MTTSELLDAMEARIEELRRKYEPRMAFRQPPVNGKPLAAADVHWTNTRQPPCPATSRATELRRQMERTGFTTETLAAVLEVPRHSLASWMTGETAVPGWVIPSVYVLGLLTPGARQHIRNSAGNSPAESGNAPRRPNPHPFSRIEDL